MKKRLYSLLTVFGAVIILTSCSTTIHATIQRPAEIDLNGAQTIAVLPVQVSESNIFRDVAVIGDIADFFNTVKNSSNGSYEAASRITSGLEKGINNSDYLQLVYSEAVKSAINAGKKAPCDVYLTGKITQFSNEIKNKKRTVLENGEKKQVTYYYREIEFTLNYQIIDSATNRILASEYETLNATSLEEEDEGNVWDSMKTMQSQLDDIIENILHKIQPYSVVKSLSLLKDKTKDPDMKTADRFVKDGLLESARTLYLKIYDSRGYFEAGYNAAIILEAQGRYEDAYTEMHDLYLAFGDKRAATAMNDIRYEIESQRTLRDQLER